MRKRLLIATLAATFLAAMSPGARCEPARSARGRMDTAYTSPGAYGVGVKTLHLVDPTRPTMLYGPYDGSSSRAIDLEVWYPAAPGHGLDELRDAAPADSARAFPLVVRAHALG